MSDDAERELASANVQLRIRSFQVSALMDAIHVAHPQNGYHGDECPTCAFLISQANEAADQAFLLVGRLDPAATA